MGYRWGGSRRPLTGHAGARKEGPGLAWRESTGEERRAPFLTLGLAEGASAACRRFGVSRETGHTWLARARDAAAGEPLDLADRSSRPHASPGRTPPALAAAVVARRDAHPARGGGQLGPLRRREGGEAVPAPSTVTALLRRHGRLTAPARPRHARLRFAAEQPNEAWQGDHLGDRPLADGGRCHPLPLIDDPARSCLLARACPDQTLGTA